MAGRRILIVDDERIVAEDLREILQRLGYVVCGMAGSGESAIAKAEAESPDLVLMDIVLQGDMDGIQAAQAIRERIGTPVVYTTAFSDPVVLERAKATAPLGYVVKPYSERELAPVLETALHRADLERQLAEREEWFSTTLSSIGDGVVATDAEGRIRVINPPACALIGCGPDEVTGRRLDEVVVILSEGGYELVDNPVARALADGVGTGLLSRALLVRRRDGERVPVEGAASCIRDRRGQPHGVVLVLRDIGERRRAELALRLSEEQHRTTLDSLGDAVHVVDEQMRVVLANRRLREWHRQLGLGEVVAGDTLATMQPFLMPQELESYRVVFAEGATVVAESRLHIGPHEVDVEIRKIPVHQGKRTVRVVTLLRDVTEQRQLERERLRLQEQVQLSQKYESLGVLAGGIAHDFNNILMSVLGNAELALEGLGNGTDVRDLISAVRDSSLRAADLCRQMLAYSGKGQIVTKTLDLNGVIREMASLVEAAVPKKAVLEWHLADRLPSVTGDDGQVRQVVLNLVTNAAEAIGDKAGRIRIATRCRSCDRAYLGGLYLDTGLAEGTYVTMEVADDGCGMDAATQKRIFDPFFTTKFLGRGLGLAAVLGIVRGHHGGIRVDSEVGRGAVFTVLLPAVPAAPSAQASVDAAPGAAAVPRRTVLVVDDEDPVRAVVTRVLKANGLDVLGASNGREALNVYRQHGPRVALVLLDLTMPEMDGYETLRELRKMDPAVKVLLSSGYSEEAAGSAVTQQGACGFIQKPYRVRELVDKVREIMGA